MDTWHDDSIDYILKQAADVGMDDDEDSGETDWPGILGGAATLAGAGLAGYGIYKGWPWIKEKTNEFIGNKKTPAGGDLGKVFDAGKAVASKALIPASLPMVVPAALREAYRRQTASGIRRAVTDIAGAESQKDLIRDAGVFNRGHMRKIVSDLGSPAGEGGFGKIQEQANTLRDAIGPSQLGRWWNKTMGNPQTEGLLSKIMVNDPTTVGSTGPTAASTEKPGLLGRLFGEEQRRLAARASQLAPMDPAAPNMNLDTRSLLTAADQLKTQGLTNAVADPAPYRGVKVPLETQLQDVIKSQNTPGAFHDHVTQLLQHPNISSEVKIELAKFLAKAKQYQGLATARQALANKGIDAKTLEKVLLSSRGYGRLGGRWGNRAAILGSLGAAGLAAASGKPNTGVENQ